MVIVTMFTPSRVVLATLAIALAFLTSDGVSARLESQLQPVAIGIVRSDGILFPHVPWKKIDGRR
jgi:hypothetical protein